MSLKHHNNTGLTNRDVDDDNYVFIITIILYCVHFMFLWLFMCFRKHNSTGHTNKYYYAIFCLESVHVFETSLYVVI